MLAFFLASSTPTAGEALSGRALGISDGDTLTVLVDKRQVKVRIQGIDAPEKTQPFAERSKQNLSSMAFQKNARYVGHGNNSNEAMSSQNLLAISRRSRMLWPMQGETVSTMPMTNTLFFESLPVSSKVVFGFAATLIYASVHDHFETQFVRARRDLE